MHYKFDWIGDFSIDPDGGKVRQSESWIIMRSIYKAYQLLTMTVLLVMSFFVF